MKKRLDSVLGTKTATKRQDPETIDEEEEFEPTVKTTSSSKSSPVDDDEDDTLSYFQKLAES